MASIEINGSVEMAAAADPEELTAKKKSKIPLIVGMVLAIVGGGAGFFAVKSGVIGGATEGDEEHAAEPDVALESATAISFVPLDPLVISLPASGGRTHLRFTAQLEVAPEYALEVESVKPRIVDVLNSYLRAVRIDELEDPTTLIKLRGQMLRRVQIVTGEGRVRDLLIMEFVLN